MKGLILLIESDFLIRLNILELLENDNFNIISAEDGLLGLRLAKEFQPDLIICDINTPYVNRFRILKKLRDDFTTAKIPCLFLTSEIEQYSYHCNQQLDADDYLIKPVKNEPLLAAIYRQLKTTQNQSLDFV